MRFKGGVERLAKLGCTFTLNCIPVSDGDFIWKVRIDLPDGRTADSLSTAGPNTAADAAVREAKRLLGID